MAFVTLYCNFYIVTLFVPSVGTVYGGNDIHFVHPVACISTLKKIKTQVALLGKMYFNGLML